MKQNQQAQNQTKTIQGGEAMKQNQQTQNQPKTTRGGEAMIYFVTFMKKLEKEKVKGVIGELYKIFPGKTPVFMSKPPAGKKLVMNVGGVLTIITIPYQQDTKQSPKQETPNQTTQEGFRLADLIKQT